MCLMAFAWQQGEHRLTLIGNRDEFHARPTREAVFWTDEDHPELLAGKDLEAGGTWLGVTRSGRFAALTNIRAPGAPAGQRSRGALALDYLTGAEAPEDYLQALATQLGEYAGFNLLVGDRSELWHLNSQEGTTRQLGPGIYGLSNASLDSPWPKVTSLREALAQNPNADSPSLMALLTDRRIYPDDQLPKTGVNLEWERMLSATFILGQEYGTRASTLLRIGQTDAIEFIEKRFGPHGITAGETSWRA